MDKLSRDEQIRLAARTTVSGCDGRRWKFCLIESHLLDHAGSSWKWVSLMNSFIALNLTYLLILDRLTHLLWMKPTPRATVIEFFFPGGFAYDYEFTVSIDAAGLSAYVDDLLPLAVSRTGGDPLWLLGRRVSIIFRVSV